MPAEEFFIGIDGEETTTQSDRKVERKNTYGNSLTCNMVFTVQDLDSDDGSFQCIGQSGSQVQPSEIGDHEDVETLLSSSSEELLESSGK